MSLWQQAVCRTYGEGDFASLADDPDWYSALDEIGDTLFRFLMVELSTAEDCADFDEAIARLNTARDDVERAITAVVDARVQFEAEMPL